MGAKFLLEALVPLSKGVYGIVVTHWCLEKLAPAILVYVGLVGL